MKRRLGFLLALLAAVVALAANSDPFYVRTKNTNLKQTPEAGGLTVAVLQPGMQVTYLEPAKKLGWHKISASGVEGFVYQANISHTKPSEEVIVDDKGVAQARSSQGGTSYGAATKALGEGAIRYGNERGFTRAVHEIEQGEALAKTVVDATLREHEDASKLHLVVTP